VRGNVETVGSVLDEGCTIKDTLVPKFSIKSARPLYAWPEASRVQLNGNNLDVTVGPGGTLVLEIKPA
jgi:hypothetical protein